MPKSSSFKFKKRGQKGWTTPDQQDWLQVRIPAYLALRASGQSCLNMFWIKLYNGWFKCWPNGSTDDEEQKLVCIVIQPGSELIDSPL